MSVVGNQREIYLRLVAALRPYWRSDQQLPERLQALLAREKRFGSRDRRLYRELLYTTVRYLPWIEAALDTDPNYAASVTAWLAASNRATESYRNELTQGWDHCPEDIAAKAVILKLSVDDLLPDWVQAECHAALTPAEMNALHRRASIWLRLQTADPRPVEDELAEHGWVYRVSTVRPGAIELVSEADVTNCESYRAGAFEVQDLGSQLILDCCPIAPGGNWLDACAGAGGKTLQLAQILGAEGKITAHDIRTAALRELQFRATRAGLTNIRTTTNAPQDQFDGVLVDAPCSGSGTWRRSPHLKWMTAAADLVSYATRQKLLLERFSQNVRPGGLLLYATCSLARSENEAVVADFLLHHPHFQPEPACRDYGYPAGANGTSILPARHNTDGFFVSLLRRD